MKIVKIKIDDVKPYENNVKLHPQEQIEQIKKSILDFGNNDPIAVDENNVIIEGHGRFMALQELGYKEVECIVLTNLNENQKNAYRLVHNKLTMNSDFDLRGLEEELNKIQIDMSPFEFDMKEIEKEISKLNDKERELEEDDIPEPPSNPISKIGDIWQLGRHRLMCGDSTNSDIDKLMEDMQCDLFLTDPPYNVNYKGSAGTIENDNQSSPAFRTFLYQAFHNAYDFMKSGAVFYIFHADSNGYDFRWACEENALKVRQCLIWEKSSLVLGRQDYQCIHEPILYGWK
ncbi:MAG: ParB N-terminal domain-containing protein, partial [Bacilli bacterium]